MTLEGIEIAHCFNAARRAITDMELELSPGLNAPVDLDAVARYAAVAHQALGNVSLLAREHASRAR